jgi:hypothetical protein
LRLLASSRAQVSAYVEAREDNRGETAARSEH